MSITKQLISDFQGRLNQLSGISRKTGNWEHSSQLKKNTVDLDSVVEETTSCLLFAKNSEIDQNVSAKSNNKTFKISSSPLSFLNKDRVATREKESVSLQHSLVDRESL